MSSVRQVAETSRFWVTRDRYENPLPYSIWSIEPARDHEGHWARLDPKRMGTDVRQICSAKVAEAVLGGALSLGEKIGPLKTQ
jgi:hypothetical protein